MTAFGKILLEVEDVAQVRAPPFVDRLVRIADDTQVAVRADQLFHQQILRPVRVLVFVDHREAEFPRVALADGRRLIEELHRLEQEVVEVERARVLERLLVSRVNPPDFAVARVPAVRRTSQAPPSCFSPS